MNNKVEKNKESDKNLKPKDPFLKPVIFGGLIITILSIIFAPGIFLWAIVGGYITVRLSVKITKQMVTITETLLLGLFTGIIGGTCLNILAILSFKDPENQRLLITTLKKNWPVDLQPMPDFKEILPSIFLSTCIIIILVCIIFSLIGTCIGYYISKKRNKTITKA